MTPSIRAVGLQVHGAGTASPAWTERPVGTRVGDLLLVHVVNDAVNVTVATPTGWTLVDGPNLGDTAAGNHTSYLFGRIADLSSVDRFEASLSGGASWVAVMVSVKGAPRTSVGAAISRVVRGGTPSATTHAAGVNPSSRLQFILAFFSADATNASRYWTATQVGTTELYTSAEESAHTSLAAFSLVGPDPAMPWSITETVSSAEVGNEHVVAIVEDPFATDEQYAIGTESPDSGLVLEDGSGSLAVEDASGRVAQDNNSEPALGRLELESADGVLIFEGLTPWFQRYRLEDGSGGLLLEDGSGVLWSEGVLFYALDLENGTDRLALESGAGVLISEEPELIVGEAGVVVIPGTAALTLTRFAPTILLPVVVRPGKATLTLASVRPVIALAVIPAKRSLTLTTFAPTVLAPRVVIPGVRALTLTGFAPTVVVGKVVVPGVRALTLTGFAPTILTPRLVTPGKATLTLTGLAPTIKVGIFVVPGARALALTTFAPTVLLPKLVVPGVRALTLTRFAPAVLTPRLVLPGLRALALTRFAPTVIATANVVVRPGPAALTLSRFAPAIPGHEVATTLGPGLLQTRSIPRRAGRGRARAHLSLTWHVLPRVARRYDQHLVPRTQKARAHLGVGWAESPVSGTRQGFGWSVRERARAELRIDLGGDARERSYRRIAALENDEPVPEPLLRR